MPPKKQPTPEDAAAARRIVLDGLACWECALFAAIAYIRAAVDRTNVPMHEACQQLAEYPVCPVP
ncbi:MAG TPA: hypothetical protein VIX15_01515 [Streptosporangiaceae bacterium]